MSRGRLAGRLLRRLGREHDERGVDRAELAEQRGDGRRRRERGVRREREPHAHGRVERACERVSVREFGDAAWRTELGRRILRQRLSGCWRRRRGSGCARVCGSLRAGLAELTTLFHDPLVLCPRFALIAVLVRARALERGFALLELRDEDFALVVVRLEALPLGLYDAQLRIEREPPERVEEQLGRLRELVEEARCSVVASVRAVQISRNGRTRIRVVRVLRRETALHVSARRVRAARTAGGRTLSGWILSERVRYALRISASVASSATSRSS
jgi:hypothetical protein